MLTPDLVRARRKGGQLRIVPLDAETAARALDLATTYLGIVEASLGRTRAEVEEELGDVPVDPGDQRLADGLRKLVEDACDFDVDERIDALTLRRDTFLRATEQRRALGTEQPFDRDAVLRAVAAQHTLTAEDVDRALFSDLRAAHLLRAIRPIQPRALVDGYDRAQAQAVLLRAVRVSADVQCKSAGGARLLFRKLKFLRLLHRISALPEGGFRVEIDGPFALFEQSTKYGLQLALLLPALEECDHYALTAELRWGKERTPLSLELEGGTGARDAADPPMPDDVQQLCAGIDALESPWRARAAGNVLDLPGVGLVVPDLVLEHRTSRARVYVEVLGYWSRDAVWRRVELSEKGLSERVLFCVGQRLRVSEEVLPDDAPQALYVYKGVMSAKQVVARAEKLAKARK